jgi:hypothetical protein
MNRWTFFAGMMLVGFFAIWTGLFADACFERLWPGVWAGCLLGLFVSWRVLLQP